MKDPLPIDDALPAVLQSLRQSPSLLLMAPPGSGKTTRVPPALLPLLGERDEIVVLEPRRLAARAAAARVAQELGTELGGLVGYQVRGDVRCGPKTRIRFVTEGVLVRQLVQDPFLEGVGAVCLDEFHERHLEGDLALAMLAEARSTVRPDLKLVVMSATLDPSPLLRFLPDAQVVEADGRLFPVQVVHLDRRADQHLEITVRQVVERALQETTGDVLVFLPGVGEIQRCEGALQPIARSHGVLVLPLHGRLDSGEQDRAIRPQERRKVVLSTNVAESSLTIAGVTAVVDSGLARELRFDRGRGVDILQLEKISLASATQRAGRAGRTGPGTCYRLWTALEERSMPPRTTPEVHRIDLTGPALLVRAFAGRAPVEFGWFEAPPNEALVAADRLLDQLGAIDLQKAQLLPFGKQLLTLPLHPRLGAVVMKGRELGCAVAAATAAMLLSDVDQLGRDDGNDLHAATDAFLLAEERGFPDAMCREFGSWPGMARQLKASRDRLLGGAGPRGRSGDSRDTTLLAQCLLAGFPDRVAQRAPGGEARHATIGGEARHATMVGGRGLILPAAADGHDLVLALRLLETGRQQRSRAVLTASIELADLQAVEGHALQNVVTAVLEEEAGRVVAVRELRYRDLPLKSARGGELPEGAAAEKLLPLLAALPWKWLGEQKECKRVIARARWLRERVPDLELPDWDDAAVARAAIDLLGRATDLRALRDAKVEDVLLAWLQPAQRRALQQLAPDRIELPTGRAAVVDYAAPAGPTISARLQEFYGLPSVGALAGGRVPVVLELLGPNHQPVQVTTDLASFWANVYPSVRRELSRRYPRHSWPEDPLAANPEARPQRRRRE
ncbi:MAG: ATP-dependent helicase HrpB [Planctomycetes bacterium]|nr:ATP-dependent helicase HrpB [Planctomycetota bacterium]